MTPAPHTTLRPPSVRPPGSERAALALVTSLSRWTGWTGVIVTGALIVGITFACAVTDRSVVLALLYIAPVSLASLGRGWRVGALVSVFCAVAGAYVDFRYRPSVSIPAYVDAWNWSLRTIVFVAAAWLVGALRSRLRLEVELARTDVLTSLSNRLAFFEAVERELERTKRTKRALSLAYIDLDHFKQVNDERGHEEGDRVLCAVAQCMRDVVRALDVPARLGGDEFALLLPETGSEGALHMTTRLRDAWDHIAKREKWPVKFSVGVVTTESGRTVDQLIGAADALMYEVKHAGRDAVRSCTLTGDGGARAA
ncbi:MAG: diguanylate cyclase [Sandaracinaceae bacterium]|jgi:diguanylate cyclase (GGDEF)-like protein|nr:diguanylate cyclase [Sandaracinaceae bacterium]